MMTPKPTTKRQWLITAQKYVDGLSLGADNISSYKE